MTVANDVLRRVLGESLSDQHIAVIDQLTEPQYDEDVAESLGIKATIIRTLLNDLHENSLVEYHRTKNKKTGWYTYKWVRREDRIKKHIQDHLSQKISMLQEQLEQENNGLSFKCNCGIVDYHNAMENMFICQSCGSAYKRYEDGKAVDGIVQQITEINSILQSIAE